VGEAEFEKHLNQMAAGAFEDPCTPSNPREVSVEDMKKIYIAAYNGDKINF
jgi:alcohol dehydrogenase class IV